MLCARSSKIAGLFLLVLALFCGCDRQAPASQTYDTIYGRMAIDEPVLLDILRSRCFERLWNIRNGGHRHYVIARDSFNRGEHSVGVFTLVRMFGGSLEEQVAALLHDISHTTFSHAGGFYFSSDARTADNYQDDHHENYLRRCGLAKLLESHGLSLDMVDPKSSRFVRLEQPLPDLCADRIDYNLKCGLYDGYLTQQDANQIVADLHFVNGRWYFTSVQAAEKLSRSSLLETELLWGSAANLVTAQFLGKALRRAVKLHVLTEKDIVFGTDDVVWNKLLASSDAEIKKLMHMIVNHKDFMVVGKPKFPGAFVIKGKFRGINPWVKQPDGSFRRLTDLSSDYAAEYTRVKTLMEHGWTVAVRQP